MKAGTHIERHTCMGGGKHTGRRMYLSRQMQMQRGKKASGGVDGYTDGRVQLIGRSTYMQNYIWIQHASFCLQISSHNFLPTLLKIET